MAPTFSTYLTFSELAGGDTVSFEQFCEELSQFNGPAVVYLCGVMNSVITDWQGHYRAEAHEELVRNSFAPSFADRIITAGRDAQIPRGVYHRRQLLFVSKQAILLCPAEGGKNPLDTPDSAGIGRVLLMANDLLPKGLTRSGPTTLGWSFSQLISRRVARLVSFFPNPERGAPSLRLPGALWKRPCASGRGSRPSQTARRTGHPWPWVRQTS
jgi:hypothetical protein